jgi:archaemetzincin
MDAERTARQGVEGIELAILPGIAPDLGRALVTALSRHVRIPCRVLPPADPGTGYVDGREQLDADALLAHIEQADAPPGSIRVGVTGVDIGNPIFTFFFGRARRHGRAALVSLRRLDPAFYGLPADADLTIRRAVTEIRHELGHVAGLAHCRAIECVMGFAPNVEALDRRGRGFCPACMAALPKWLR